MGGERKTLAVVVVFARSFVVFVLFFVVFIDEGFLFYMKTGDGNEGQEAVDSRDNR